MCYLLNAFQSKSLVGHRCNTNQLDETKASGTKWLNDFHVIEIALSQRFILFRRLSSGFLIETSFGFEVLKSFSNEKFKKNSVSPIPSGSIIIRNFADQVDKGHSVQRVATSCTNCIDVRITPFFLQNFTKLGKLSNNIP